MAIGSPQWMYASGEAYRIDQSLRFEDNGDSNGSYLSRTPSSTGNRKTWTYSCWVKRGNLKRCYLWNSVVSGDTGGAFSFGFSSSDTLTISDWNAPQLETSAKYRDPSAWMHIILAWDTTQATESNRAKVYVNGSQVTLNELSHGGWYGYPPQNDLRSINTQQIHTIGSPHSYASDRDFLDGYLAEVNFIDGQALTPADFGETGDYGEWKPKEYSGTYGTNGFYLPFKQDYTVEGFSTVVYKGNGVNRYLGGFGFKPGLVWQKTRDYGYGHQIVDAVRGATNEFYEISNASSGQEVTTTNGLTAFKTDGVTIGSGNGWNNSARKSVMWAWDMGADTPTGFGCVTWTGNGGTQNISGFGFSPDLVIGKGRSNGGSSRIVDTVRGATKTLMSDDSGAEYTGNAVASFEPDGFVTSSGGNLTDNGWTFVAWGWDMGNTTATNTSGSTTSQVRANTTYGQSIITYTGTGSVATIGHGLSAKPELIITKARSDSQQWGVQHGALGATKYLLLDTTGAAGTASSLWNDTEPTSSVFTVGTTATTNASSTTYVSYAFHSVSGYSKFGSYTGNGSSTGTSVTLGFRPAWLMIKRTEGAGDWKIFDSTRNPLNEVTKFLHPNDASAEGTSSSYKVDFDDNGFQIKGSGAGINNNGETYIYAAFAGGMDSISDYNTDGSIDSRVKANTTYGQSIVSYVGTGSATTVGHGLSSAPEMVVVKSRDAAENWVVFHTGINSGQGYIKLNLTDAATTGSSRRLRFGNDSDGVVPDSTKVYIGSGSEVNTSGNDYIAYCFHSVTGYSKFGSWTGNGSATGASVTTGFKPAFILWKNTDGENHWGILDSTRSPTNPRDESLYPNLSNAEGSNDADRRIDFNDTGFQIKSANNEVNRSGHTYIYMAFADKREYAYWLDQSGNNNDWTSNNLTESDISVDSPTNNFATLNPLSENTASALVVSEGNLQVTHPASGSWDSIKGTFGVSSGKWYWEVNYDSGLMTDIMTGICDTSIDNGGTNAWVTGSLLWYNHTGGELRVNGTDTSANYGLLTDGDILGIALNMDDKQITFYKNNVALVTNYSIDSNITTATAYTLQDYDAIQVFNFGQDSSFAGNKTAQGNQDSNDIGDFYYEPPTGFLALCTDNLPDVAVTPSEHFNTVLWSGNGASSHAITGVGFQSDMLWLKERTSTSSHQIHDAIRSAGTALFTNATSAESSSSTYLQSFDTDGFTVGSSGSVNSSGDTYVGWNWKANGSGSSNTNGTITSTVSANTDAGFSIVSYTGNGTADSTIGHGLSKAPEMIIVKRRNTANGWAVYNKTLGSGDEVYLNYTQAETSSNFWRNTPTASTFSVSSQDYVNTSSDTYIAYVFHSVDGYSKVGSYTGNDNADGTFVYCGFKPAFVLIKNTVTSGEGFVMFNNKSDPSNVVGTYLTAYGSTAEQGTAGTTSSRSIDFVSNGFKIRGNSTEINDGEIHIFYAVAETPFKYSNGR